MNRPEAMLREFREALLISFSYDEEGRVFEVVSDSLVFVGKSKREFVRWTFSGVVDFERNLGLSSKWARFNEFYNIRDEEGGVVFQEIRHLWEEGDRSRILLGLGLSFGSVEFTYESLALRRRIGLGTYEQKEGSYIYLDSTTRERFAFHNPFP